ncbi:hypothetical protein OSH11_13795 [Kaistia dalseonensis]|uniref:GcrA cell cycle regulator n=1 Tax=Kaistia dalseonensis TaxID=410840 RepID=A0ABU0H7U0_9HYPH|nr:GcrA family cell cycle regulator [Kaistia dalseonensis]MCX5495782.1 hypothetical protein [Kaistia dalseonensis]MDQ0438383.1 hypothetical protein [Kaistia dalseonensis]
MTSKLWKDLTRDEKRQGVIDGRRRGLSSALIAEALGAPSRNAILGVVHRIINEARADGAPSPIPPYRPTARVNGTGRAPSVAGKKLGSGPKAKNRPAEITEEAAGKRPSPSVSPIEGKQQRDTSCVTAGETAPLHEPIAYLERNGTQCAWPIGPWEGVPIAQKLFCGAPVPLGKFLSPYCSDHHRVATTPPADRRRFLAEGARA